MSVPDGYDTSFRPGGTDDQTKATLRRTVAVPYSKIHRERVEWLVPGRIPLGAVSIVAGEPGLGKSMYAIGLAARLSQQGVASLVLSAEDAEGATIRPRLDACEAAADLVHAVHLVGGDEGDGLALPADVGELDRLIADTGARLVVVDPIVAYLDGGIDSHKDASVRQALAPLSRIAASRSCAVVAVLHVNKAIGSDWYRRLSGSGGFGGAARSVLFFGRDPDDADAERGSGRLLAHAKCNVGPLAPSELWSVIPILLPADGTGPETPTARLDRVGESDHDYRALLDWGSDPEERLPRDEAEAFLRAELSDGAQPAKDVQRAAREAGISERTLRRARKRLGVVPEKQGRGGWTWRLPEGGHTKEGHSERQEVATFQETSIHAGLAASMAPETPKGGHVSRVAAFGTNAWLLPGDPGYLHNLSVAKEAGHVTEGEWERLKPVHQKLRRRVA